MKKLIRNIVCAASVAVALSGCNMQNVNWGKVTEGAVKVGQAASITDEQLNLAVSQSIKAMDAQGNVAPASSPYTKRLNSLVSNIKTADGIPLNFKVYQTKEVNAFACPDGSVRVYSGLMDMMTDDELLGIIGHEIGHVALHHSKNAYRTQLLAAAARDGLSAMGGYIGQLSDSQLGDLGLAYANSKFSQKQENEADDCAYDFLVMSKKNPWGMVMAFEKFDQLEQAGGNANAANYIAKMFSSHPETKDRIKHITDRCIKDKYERPASK